MCGGCERSQVVPARGSRSRHGHRRVSASPLGDSDAGDRVWGRPLAELEGRWRCWTTAATTFQQRERSPTPGNLVLQPPTQGIAIRRGSMHSYRTEKRLRSPLRCSGALAASTAASIPSRGCASMLSVLLGPRRVPRWWPADADDVLQRPRAQIATGTATLVVSGPRPSWR